MHALVHRHRSKSNLVDKKPDTYLDNFYVMNSFLFMLKTGHPDYTSIGLAQAV